MLPNFRKPSVRGTAYEKKWMQAIHSIEFCCLCGVYGVQVSHSNMHRGMSQKSHPAMCAALCPACHFSIDNDKSLSQLERRELHARAINLTHMALIESGALILQWKLAA